MKLKRITSICLLICVVGQFLACSGSKKGGAPQAAVLRGGPACQKITDAFNKRMTILLKEKPEAADVEQIKQLVAELEKISQDHVDAKDYNCLIRGIDGENQEMDRDELLT